MLKLAAMSAALLRNMTPQPSQKRSCIICFRCLHHPCFLCYISLAWHLLPSRGLWQTLSTPYLRTLQNF